ncbi:MAG: OmpA family protein [Geminicoccaceae bacterium]
MMRILLGLLVVLFGLLTGYSASRYKAPDIQADIDHRTEAELAAIETVSEIAVETDGRHVTLKGYAASEAEKAAIIERAEDVWGGLVPIDEIRLLEVVDPYKLSLIKDADGHITLSGVVPSEAARETLLARAEEVFGDNVESDLTLAAGVPEGDWIGAVSKGMDGLAGLNHGRLDATNEAIELIGEAKADEDADRILGLEAETPDSFTWSALLDIEKPDISPFTLAIEKLGGDWKVQGYAPDEATRVQLLAKIQAAVGDDEVRADIQLADGMPDEDWPVTAAVAIDALAKLEAGRLEISDQDVRIGGDVRGQADLDALKALQEAVPNGANWMSDLVVLRPTVRPYVVEIDKSEDGQWSISGAVPDEVSRDALIDAVKSTAEGRDVVAKLQLADGVPGVDWQRFVEDRLPALNSVDAGTLRFEDYDVSLDGSVSTVDDAVDADAEVTAIDPTIETQLEALDTTIDAFLDLRLSPDDGVVVDGALPPGLSEREAVDLLGLKAGHSGELSENGRGDAEAWRRDLSAIGSYLPEFETVELSLKDGRAAIDGETHAKSDAEQVIDRLTDALDDRWRPTLNIETTDTRFTDGIRRSNPLSGIEEEYRRGFWLPVTTISAGLDACRERTSLILASNKITFLVGEARLDARARRIINDLSSVAIGCLGGNGNLYLEIGGHTDSRGADDLNQRLSQARADSVLNALADRGVAADALTARGYGETDPIADNTSKEGRSANRRITFKWQHGAKADG